MQPAEIVAERRGSSAYTERVHAHRLGRVGMASAFAGTMVYWLVVAWPHFAYLHDDLILFSVASHSGLSWHLLTFNLFEHFSPIDHAFYWLELTISPLNPAVGAIIAGVLVAGMLGSLNWLLLELEVSWVRRALAVLVLGSSIVTVTVTTWWGQAVYIPVATSLMLLLMAAHRRAIRLRARRWHLVACGFAVLGFLISERTLFTPAFLVLLDVAIARRDRSWSEAARQIWRLRWPFAGLFAISLAGGLFIRAKYYVAYPLPRLSEVGHLIVAAYSQWFLPSLGGFYSNGGVSPPLGGVLAVASLIVGLVCVAIDRGNIAPLAFCAAVFAADYGFLGLGRLGLYSAEQGARDIQYVAWVLPLFLVGLCLLRFPRRRRQLPSVRRAAIAVGAVLIAAILLNGIEFTREESAFRVREASNQYYTNLRSGIDKWSAASATVVPTRVPADFAADFSDPYGRMEVLLPELRPGVEVGRLDPGNATVLIDAQGNVRPAEMQVLTTVSGEGIAATAIPVRATVQTANAQACVTPGAPKAYLQVILPVEVKGSALNLVLSYSSPSETATYFTGYASSGFRNNPLPSSIHAGAHTAIFALEADDAAGVQITDLSPGHGFCIRALSVVQPLIRDGSGECRTVDHFGLLGATARCPPKP